MQTLSKKVCKKIQVMDVDGVWSETPKEHLKKIEGKILPKTCFMLITPEIARNLLDNKNVRNRKLSPIKVNIYSQELTDGKWRITHQGIAFYEDGVLADGQHRLEAIVRTGVSIIMLVAFGLSYESAIFIDEGKSRSVADVSAISPFHDAISTDMMGVGSCVISSLIGKDKKSGAAKRIFNGTRNKLEFCEKHREALLESCRIEKQTGYMSAVKIFRSVLFRMYYNIDRYNFTQERYEDLIEAVNQCIIRKNPENNIERLWKKVSEHNNRTGYKFYAQCHRWTEKCFYNFMTFKNMDRMSEEKNEIFLVPEELEIIENN